LDSLKGAAAAHGEHEANDLGGVYDEAWPDWYAQHMSASLKDEGFAVDPAFLADELRAAAAAHGQRDKSPDDPDDNWPGWYVTRMLPAVVSHVATA
jgi:hypothetical protein